MMRYQIRNITRTKKGVQVEVTLDKELSDLLKDNPFAALGTLFFDFQPNASEALIVSNVRNWFIQARILAKLPKKRDAAVNDLAHLNGQWFDL
jgi:hypothetical protein